MGETSSRLSNWFKGTTPLKAPRGSPLRQTSVGNSPKTTLRPVDRQQGRRRGLHRPPEGWGLLPQSVSRYSLFPRPTSLTLLSFHRPLWTEKGLSHPLCGPGVPGVPLPVQIQTGDPLRRPRLILTCRGTGRGPEQEVLSPGVSKNGESFGVGFGSIQPGTDQSCGGRRGVGDPSRDFDDTEVAPPGPVPEVRQTSVDRRRGRADPTLRVEGQQPNVVRPTAPITS